MPMTVTCSQAHAFFVEESQIGDLVRCPYCDERLLVPDPRPNAKLQVEEDEEFVELEPEESELPKKKKARARQQRRVDLGLQFHYAKIVCLLGALAVWMMLSATMPLQDTLDGGMATLIRIIGAISILGLFIIAPVLGIIGSILCCFVPRRTRARPLIVGSLVLDLIPFLLVVVALLIALLARLGLAEQEGAIGVARVVQVLALLLLVAGWAVFMLFLRRLADYLDEGGQHEEALSILVGGILIMVTPGLLVSPILIFRGTTFALVFAVVVALGMVWWLSILIKLLFRNLTVIGRLRDVIRDQGGIGVQKN